MVGNKAYSVKEIVESSEVKWVLKLYVCELLKSLLDCCSASVDSMT